MAQVIDASVAIAWCVPAQSTPVTVAALKYATADGGYVPAQFWFEVLHGLARLEHRGMILRTDVDEFVSLLSELSLAIDRIYDAAGMLALNVLARRFSLNIYDASYLELALRTGVPLATRDVSMAKAATEIGIVLVSA